MVVVVTGAGGQLGQALQSIAEMHPEITFVFCDSKRLDITKTEHIEQVFNQFRPDFCINAAAYTAVDKAESEPEQARLINVVGAKNIAKACKKYDSVLLHISTDFVFSTFVIDGKPFYDKEGQFPLWGLGGLREKDIPNPISIYGQTKLDGEKVIQETWHKHVIIRTSWVYSQFGHNFMKTMLRLATERKKISVVNDQIGTPTHAVDLAKVLIKIIAFCESVPPSGARGLFGIYHFSNEGQCSWYYFAKKIFEFNNININLEPITTTSFPTPAQRPMFSVLDKSKIKKVFGVEVRYWETSLKNW